MGGGIYESNFLSSFFFPEGSYRGYRQLLSELLGIVIDAIDTIMEPFRVANVERVIHLRGFSFTIVFRFQSAQIEHNASWRVRTILTWCTLCILERVYIPCIVYSLYFWAYVQSAQIEHNIF